MTNFTTRTGAPHQRLALKTLSAARRIEKEAGRV